MGGTASLDAGTGQAEDVAGTPSLDKATVYPGWVAALLRRTSVKRTSLRPFRVLRLSAVASRPSV